MFVCRSPQDEAQLPMEPIAEENIEMPEAQTESRDMLRYFIQYTQHTHRLTNTHRGRP